MILTILILIQAVSAPPPPPTPNLLTTNVFFIMNDNEKKLTKCKVLKTEIQYRLHKKSFNETSNISHNCTKLILIGIISIAMMVKNIIHSMILTQIKIAFYSIQYKEWLHGFIWPFPYFYTTNQVSHIREYRCLKNVIHQVDSKNEYLLFSANFMAKYGLVFVFIL